MRRVIGTQVHARMVNVPVLGQGSVGRRSVGVHPCSGLDGPADKREQVRLRGRWYPSQSDPTEPLRLLHLDCDGDQGPESMALTPRPLERLARVTDANIGLIHFNLAVQALPARTHHRAAKPMQHRPARLVAPQSQYPLQPQGAHPELLVGEVPGGGKPGPQWRARLVEHRSGAHRTLIPTPTAHQTAATGPIRLARLTAPRTDKPLRPTQLLKIAQASLLIGEPVQELIPVARIVSPGDQGDCRLAHPYILG